MEQGKQWGSPSVGGERATISQPLSSSSSFAPPPRRNAFHCVIIIKVGAPAESGPSPSLSCICRYTQCVLEEMDENGLRSRRAPPAVAKFGVTNFELF